MANLPSKLMGARRAYRRTPLLLHLLLVYMVTAAWLRVESLALHGGVTQLPQSVIVVGYRTKSKLPWWKEVLNERKASMSQEEGSQERSQRSTSFTATPGSYYLSPSFQSMSACTEKELKLPPLTNRVYKLMPEYNFTLAAEDPRYHTAYKETYDALTSSPLTTNHISRLEYLITLIPPKSPSTIDYLRLLRKLSPLRKHSQDYIDDRYKQLKSLLSPRTSALTTYLQTTPTLLMTDTQIVKRNLEYYFENIALSPSSRPPTYILAHSNLAVHHKSLRNNLLPLLPPTTDPEVVLSRGLRPFLSIPPHTLNDRLLLLCRQLLPSDAKVVASLTEGDNAPPSLYSLPLAKILTRHPQILKHAGPRIDEILIYLSTSIPCSLPNARKIILAAPSIASALPETLAARITSLNVHLGIYGPISSVVLGNPNLLTLSPDTIPMKLEFLSNLGVPPSSVRLHPRLLSASTSLLSTRRASLQFLFPSMSMDKLLRSAPNLLLRDVEKSIAPKLSELKPQMNIMNDPRLLLYSPETLTKKLGIWCARTSTPLPPLVDKYPTLLTYGPGLAGRLEYYYFRNRGNQPDAPTSRTLLMMTRAKVQLWGERDSERSLPKVLNGVNSRAGRPRIGEIFADAMERVAEDAERSIDVKYTYKEYLAARILEPPLLYGEGSDDEYETPAFTETSNPIVNNDARRLAKKLLLRDLEKLYGNILMSREVVPYDFDDEEEEQGRLDLYLVRRAISDEAKLREGVIYATTESFRRLLPTADVQEIARERPSVLYLGEEKLKNRVIGLRKLMGGIDLGKLVTREPRLLDVLSISLVSERFASVLDAVPTSYSAVAGMVAREPELLMEEGKWMVATALYLRNVAEDEDEVIELIVRAPGVLRGMVSRLEYLGECGARGSSGSSVGWSPSMGWGAIGDSDDDDLCQLTDDFASPKLEVGHIPALLRRPVDSMMERNPFYDVYVREKIKEAGIEVSEGMEIEELEVILGQVILKAFAQN